MASTKLNGCQDAIRVFGAVAELGLRIGILILGGLYFGEMFPQAGVVLGETMVDAAEPEKNYSDLSDGAPYRPHELN